MEEINTAIQPQSEAFRNRVSEMSDLTGELRKCLRESLGQGAPKYCERHRKQGKLLARERVRLLLDRDSPFLELMPLAGYGQKEMTPGGSIVGGIGLVNGVECLVNANIPTIKGGALNEVSMLKARRLDEIAAENRLPTVYLTESAGADLPQQAKVFNYGGAIFREITRRSKKGIPSVNVVFGSSTAGGAYLPGMSDYVIMVKNQARVFLAGPPLVRMATGEETDDESLGGADMHSRISGVSDYLAEDEHAAISKAREIIGTFLDAKKNHIHADPVEQPFYDAEELLGIVSPDVKVPFDSREVIARIVDGSRFSEFKPLYGESLVTGWAKIHGFMTGILANNGVLFSESANKGAQFIQLCNQRETPLIFLQNITGFMVGRRYEEGGIIKHGAKLINAVANSDVAAITLLTGASYGAGNYGMSGRAYQPRFLFAWPNARLAVMGSEQLAGVMEIIQTQAALKQGKILDPEKVKSSRQAIEEQIERESDAYYCTSRVWDDGIIDPRDTRDVLGFCLSVIHNTPISGGSGYGVFRM